MHGRDRTHTTWPMDDLRRCVSMTLDDLAAAIARGRTITPPNLRRLFERRWYRVVEEHPRRYDAVTAEAARVLGRMMIREGA